MDGHPPANDEVLTAAFKKVGYLAKQEHRTAPWVALDDLKQAGLEGYLKALQTYDPKYGVELLTWTEIKARGAMRDLVRQERRARRIRHAVHFAEASAPSGEFEKVATKAAVMMTALLAYADNYVVVDDSDPEASLSDQDAKEKLRAHLHVLPPQERKVIELVCKDLSNQEIAALLDVKKSTVSHQIAAAAGRLQRALDPRDEES